jgi:hypothetical protein
MSGRDTTGMFATTLLLAMVVGALFVLLAGVGLMRQSARTTETVSAGDGTWSASMFSDGSSGDCSAGDAGCDGGGGE